MKTLLIISCFITLPLYSQNHNLSILPRFGVSTNSFKLVDPAGGHRYDYRRTQPLNDIGLKVDYHYRIWKRFDGFLTAGIDASQATHYQRVIETDRLKHLDNIVLKKFRLGFHFGVMKRIAFMEDRLLLDLGGSLVFRQFFNETNTYTQDFRFNNEDWIEYNYSLKTFHGTNYENNKNIPYTGRFGTELSALLKFRCSPHSYLNFGFSYSTRNTFFYDYRFTVRYYMNDSPTPTYTIQNVGLLGDKYGVLDNYLYLNFGYTFVFKNRLD
jgi:hypothetical protein